MLKDGQFSKDRGWNTRFEIHDTGKRQAEIEIQTHHLSCPDDQVKTNILLIIGHHHHLEMAQMVSKVKEFTCCVFVKCIQ